MILIPLLRNILKAPNEKHHTCITFYALLSHCRVKLKCSNPLLVVYFSVRCSIPQKCKRTMTNFESLSILSEIVEVQLTKIYTV